MPTFLKLGGSLITNKDIPYSPRRQVIKRVGIEIFKFMENNPDHRLLIGHGSGSFGHAAAAATHTIRGVKSREDWLGFQGVWWAAHRLNQIVCEILIEVGLPVIAMPASAAAMTKNRNIVNWCSEPIERAIEGGLIPVIYGDVILDTGIGGTILSTEELFSYLIPSIAPEWVLLAGSDAGVFRDFPQNHDLIDLISPQSVKLSQFSLEKSAHQDVTGGMAAKVKEMLQIVEAHPEIKVQIFSGEIPENISKALSGDTVGTVIADG